MSDLRTAAQQALEACEQRLPLVGQAAIIDELNNLRAALAQQVEPRNQCGETCERAKLCATCAQALAQQAEPLNLRDPAVQKRLATQWGYVPAAQAEPVEEPVYKVKVTSRWHDTEPLAPAFSLPDGEHLLYTAPPQRRPLTQEESDNIYREFTLYQDRLTPSVLQRIVRAVERAHGIGEQS